MSIHKILKWKTYIAFQVIWKLKQVLIWLIKLMYNSTEQCHCAYFTIIEKKKLKICWFLLPYQFPLRTVIQSGILSMFVYYIL